MRRYPQSPGEPEDGGDLDIDLAGLDGEEFAGVEIGAGGYYFDRKPLFLP